MRWNDFKHIKMFTTYMCALDIILVFCHFRGYLEIMKLYISCQINCSVTISNTFAIPHQYRCEKTPPPLCLSMIIKWLIFGLFSLDIDNLCIWAVAGKSGLPSMRKLLLTIKGCLFGNSFPWLSVWWTSCYLTVELIFPM